MKKYVLTSTRKFYYITTLMLYLGYKETENFISLEEGQFCIMGISVYFIPFENHDLNEIIPTWITIREFHGN